MIINSTAKSIEIIELKKLVARLMRRVEGLEYRLTKAEQENLALIDGNIVLLIELDDIQTSHKELAGKLKSRDKAINTLSKENRSLLDKLHRKNSRNSSIPPSKDENRPLRNSS